MNSIYYTNIEQVLEQNANIFFIDCDMFTFLLNTLNTIEATLYHSCTTTIIIIIQNQLHVLQSVTGLCTATRPTAHPHPFPTTTTIDDFMSCNCTD